MGIYSLIYLLLSSHKLIENCFGDRHTFWLPINHESDYSLATTVIYQKILTFAKDISKIMASIWKFGDLVSSNSLN